MLEIQNLTFSAETDGSTVGIIRGIDLTIPDGKFVVITGPNGGGKSTLARLIAGILTPTSGKLLLDGEDITEKSITDRAKGGIGFAFQQPVRFKGLTVLDLLRIAAGKTTARSTLPCPAASSSASRSQPFSPAMSSWRYSMNRKPASTCGVSRTSSASSRVCASPWNTARSSSFPTRSAS